MLDHIIGPLSPLPQEGIGTATLILPSSLPHTPQGGGGTTVLLTGFPGRQKRWPPGPHAQSTPPIPLHSWSSRDREEGTQVTHSMLATNGKGRAKGAEQVTSTGPLSERVGDRKSDHQTYHRSQRRAPGLTYYKLSTRSPMMWVLSTITNKQSWCHPVPAVGGNRQH